MTNIWTWLLARKQWLTAVSGGCVQQTTTDRNLFDQQEINGYQMSQRATKKAAKKDHNIGGRIFMQEQGPLNQEIMISCEKIFLI